ncbi:MAG: gamma-glutamyltransferase [Deltaproteobacteria bacterium]
MARSTQRANDQEALEDLRRQVPWPQRIAASPHGMVSTANHRATEAGTEVLSQGGNAVDAATAAGFALGVCEPASSGLGGQTMMLIFNAETRKTVALDGSSRAPNRATPGSLSHSERLRGHCATTVPSTPAVLEYARRTYGTMTLAQILAPSIKLAEQGFEVSDLLHTLTKRELRNLKAGSAAPFFLHDGRRPYSVGATLRQPVLARTFTRLSENGVEDFYLGGIARDIYEDMEENNGLLHLDDLAQIPWPIERRPIATMFAHHRIMTFPPPGAGRTLIEMLKILSHFPENLWNADTPEGAVVLAEVIRRANLDRRDRPFDPNFYPQVEDRRMLSSDYAKLVSRQVRKRVRIKTSGETTHLSVMDRAGNAVALTQSIERVYGSFQASPKLGFLYNNYMSAFEYEDMSHPYFLRPNAVPWASVAPTIVFRGRRPWAVLGSPGSERIASSILQVLLRLRRQPPYDAVAGPRLHCSREGKVSLEASRMRDDIPAALEKRGFEVSRREPYSFHLGCIQLVLRDGKKFIGVADPRRDGSAGGPKK